jgi:hypothetical protein
MMQAAARPHPRDHDVCIHGTDILVGGVTGDLKSGAVSSVLFIFDLIVGVEGLLMERYKSHLDGMLYVYLVLPNIVPATFG